MFLTVRGYADVSGPRPVSELSVAHEVAESQGFVAHFLLY